MADRWREVVFIKIRGEPIVEVRIDTYLWAIRMYRSRNIASSAIKGGKVKCNDEKVKPSRVVKEGEIYTMTLGTNKKIIEVVDVTDKRGNFETAKKYYRDLSPPPVKSQKLPPDFFTVSIQREKGSGRPTKKDRRNLKKDFGWE